MSKKGEIIIEIKAEELGLAIENLAEELVNEFQEAIKQTANAAYANIIADAQTKLGRTRQDYLKGLKFDNLGNNNYLISLDGEWPNKIEDGYPSYDMKSTLLNSDAKVSQGSRSGLPWVQEGKNGKYAHVPFEQKPFSKAPQANDLGAAIKQLETYNMQGRKQKFTKIFRDPSGKALSGKVASVGDTGIPNLDGITKFQQVSTSKSGKETVSSVYMTWRTISENSSGWTHPGYSGLNAFQAAEMWVEKEIENILKNFLA